MIKYLLYKAIIKTISEFKFNLCIDTASLVFCLIGFVTLLLFAVYRF